MESVAGGVEEDEALLSAEEEYQVWKKNTPYLYDLLISHVLEWPSLTVQWLPSQTLALTNPLLLGTHTSDGQPNSLLLASASFGEPDVIPRVDIARSAPHVGEVNRVRFMPQTPSVVVTKTCRAEIHVFDLASDGAGPVVVLRGHEAEGYGIAWNENREGKLLSGSYDSKICLWDLRSGDGRGTLDAEKVFTGHEAAVEDVAWRTRDDYVFASVGDDCKLMIWDLRSSTQDKPEKCIVAHKKEVNSLSFNPFNEWILATASADTTVSLFDLRNLKTTLHTFLGHTEEAVQVQWSPTQETLLATSANDKKIMIWDLNRIGDEQSEEDAEDGPAELLFAHAGHTAKISEFSWNPAVPWLIASVGEDNTLQVWQTAGHVYSDTDPALGDDKNDDVIDLNYH